MMLRRTGGRTRSRHASRSRRRTRARRPRAVRARPTVRLARRTGCRRPRPRARSRDRCGAASHRRTRSDHHAVAEIGEALLADAPHLAQLVHRAESAAAVAFVDDRAGKRGPDTRQRLELCARGVVEVDERAGSRVAGGWVTGRGALTDLGDEDALAVDEL